jgi:hypothetical protein
MISPKWYSGPVPTWHQLPGWEKLSVEIGLPVFLLFIAYMVYKTFSKTPAAPAAPAAKPSVKSSVKS